MCMNRTPWWRLIMSMSMVVVTSALVSHKRNDNPARIHVSGRKILHFPLQTSAPNSESTNSNLDVGSNKGNTTTTVARAGGRRLKTMTSRKTNNPDKNRFLQGILRQWALPGLALIVILRFILSMFGGGDSNNPNVVYYSRSVYQSTTYTRDGNVETTRRENFQSNIPELVKQSQQRKNADGEVTNSKDFFDVVDVDIQDEIDSLLFRKW